MGAENELLGRTLSASGNQKKWVSDEPTWSPQACRIMAFGLLLESLAFYILLGPRCTGLRLELGPHPGSRAQEPFMKSPSTCDSLLFQKPSIKECSSDHTGILLLIQETLLDSRLLEIWVRMDS